MKTNLKIDELAKAGNSDENLNKAIDILSLLDGKTIEECENILGTVKYLISANSTFSLSRS
jgi:hypothetical protein